MEPVLTPEEMLAADQATIDGGTSGIELMERAAHACSVTALRMLGGAYGRSVVVVCGKGNNGGDGIACGRHLATAGVRATVFLIDEPSGDAAHHLDLARTALAAGRLRILPWSTERFEREAQRADLVVDAIFGTGFSGAPKAAAADAIDSIAAASAPVLAIDIPSGVSGADGQVPGSAVTADVTVAIQAVKVGHLSPPGAFLCGRIEVADIGIATSQASIFVPQATDVSAGLPAGEADTHKYRVGALAILAGSSGMTGAAILTARGAIRAGAGLVLLGVPAPTLEIFEGAVVEAIKIPLPSSEGQLEAKAVDEMADRLERCRALAIGPGLGRGPRAVAVVRRALDIPLPLVVDGDGLWALGEILSEDASVLRSREHPTILTPHGGEFSYLTGGGPGRDRVADVREASSRWNAVVHLKGRRALTAATDGRVWVNTTGNPGLATGGTGDVLTGVVGALLAQGAGAAEATWAGAYLHGLAGDIVADRVGRRALAAHDLPDALAPALRRVERPAISPAPLRTVIERTT
jgi:NAD(P)H-hydrate epimerase